MIPVDCRTCRQKGRCAMEAGRYRQALFAWAKGKDLPDCQDYLPRYHHGVDGVFSNCSFSPRPSRSADEQRSPS